MVEVLISKLSVLWSCYFNLKDIFILFKNFNKILYQDKHQGMKLVIKQL